ncbi:glycosyltransferase family 2 protein [Phormidesmis priestleyi ULC007]|uniref:Glycosyltransferase family 2 protein n=1 Tax=Phormidesmis priestleyi ULC007 TaxID=1920490 RepID=A0A2T1D5V6_9CYAN|nr:glycosyltransferase family 2 protein [Phormidesmis priestleyi]PSB15893.1 glycosyltransferase family 2 protein [Phormidesmis priestleyi ULC007]PZO53494.1 MAG: glycosyltransferase family 2 protein [Phormidesmis priestleyi]
MPEPQVSAIICTHNREHYLGAAIGSLLSQNFANFEVVVIDNASSDRTRAVVEARLSDPRLSYVHEPVMGLSVARNTGAKSAQSEILAYLDDDAIASPQWLQTLWDAYQTNEKLAIAGGKVTLIWDDGMVAPAWLSDGLAGNLGAYDLGTAVLYIDRPGLTPRGLNYSIRRTFLEQVGGFDLNLGRVGKNLLSNEELHMTKLALQAGWQVAYLPDALVAHHVSPERVKRGWFLSRGWWQGISECYQEQIVGEAGLKQFHRGGERLLRGLYKSVKFAADPAQRFENLVYSYGQIGYLSKAAQGLISPALTRS